MLGANIIARMGPYQLLHTYLMASYCYYQRDMSPLTDDAFDLLCKRLQTAYDSILDDPHAHLVDRDELEAGTGYYIPEASYPNRVRHTAEEYYYRCVSGEMAKRLESFLEPVRVVKRVGRTAPVAQVKRVGRTLPTPKPVAKRFARTIR